MAYYKTCRNCGSNLDPGEICDCRADHRPSWSEAITKAPFNYLDPRPKPGTFGSDISSHKPAKVTSRTPYYQSSLRSKI